MIEAAGRKWFLKSIVYNGRILCRKLEQGAVDTFAAHPFAVRISRFGLSRQPRFATFDARIHAVRALPPEDVGPWLVGYAYQAHAGGRTHAAAHALAEAAFAFHDERRELSSALITTAEEWFAATQGPQDCVEAADAARLALDRASKPRIFDFTKPGLSKQEANSIQALVFMTGVRPTPLLWVEVLASTSGYPEGCDEAAPAGQLVEGAHHKPARRILRALARHDLDAVERDLDEFTQAALDSADHEVAASELMKLSKLLLSRQQFWAVLRAIQVLVGLADDRTTSGEVAKLCRRVASATRDPHLTLLAKSLQAHALTHGGSHDHFVQGARLTVNTLAELEDGQYPEIYQDLLWSAYFCFHKLGDYRFALACLTQIDTSLEAVSEVMVRWARYDIYRHIGFSVAEDQLADLRQLAAEEGHIRWLAEIDYLWGGLDTGDGPERATRMLLAAEGFRRAGARGQFARCMAALAEHWIAREDYDSAHVAAVAALNEFTRLKDASQVAGLLFGLAHIGFVTNEIDFDEFERAYRRALVGEVFEHQVTLTIQFLQATRPEHADLVLDQALHVLEAFTDWWSTQAMTSWRAALLSRERALRALTIKASVHANRSAQDIARLVIEGASLGVPAGEPETTPDPQPHHVVADPELAGELADVLSETEAEVGVIDDPKIHLIPLAAPVRVSLVPHDGSADALDLAAVVGVAAGPRPWTWWSQWIGNHRVYHAVLTSAGDCWYEQTDLAELFRAVAAYEDVIPLARNAGEDGDFRDRLRTALGRSPAQEETLARALGKAMIPARLAAHLAEADAGTRLFVQPSPLTVRVPFGLATLPGDAGRILDHAGVNHCPNPRYFTLPCHSGPADGSALVLDPGGRPLLGRTPVSLPVPDDLVHLLARPELPAWTTNVLPNPTPTVATRATLRAVLAEHPVRRMVYAGHVTPADAASPGAGAFVLSDGALTAADWWRDPAQFPAVEELVLIGCDSFGAAATEPLGLTTAALAAGVSRMIASTSPLPNTAGMWNAATEVAQAPPGTSYVDLVQTMQRRRLASWRETGDPRLHPLHWSSFIAVERQIPSTTRTS
ncbi:hypothetical protein VSH64_21200 [Amycolatopsis rhabdoformis]|uniref:CHAT domain-containing protein n=1 Tax=Amycolatopsis rhabdoformis TaxID=1448059 RepID=A0ABZ1IM85_9PSEU|nr:hypothetical protein [Amycolatopsis rhabdoformis]WSE34570.1 hypothetical protein VSH64_21200 [Amycolatopsis rhabdoformis]